MPQTSPTVPRDEITYSDADLVAQLRAGDEAAIAQLVDEWSPAMLRIARSFVGSAQSAEDVVQDAWLGMLSGLARFEGRSSLRTWTFSIPVNRARTRGTHEARTVPPAPLSLRGETTAEGRCAAPVGIGQRSGPRSAPSLNGTPRPRPRQASAAQVPLPSPRPARTWSWMLLVAMIVLVRCGAGAWSLDSWLAARLTGAPPVAQRNGSPG